LPPKYITVTLFLFQSPAAEQRHMIISKHRKKFPKLIFHSSLLFFDLTEWRNLSRRTAEKGKRKIKTKTFTRKHTWKRKRTEVICWQIKDGKTTRTERTNEVDERRIRATAGLDGSQLSDVQSRAHNIIVALCCVVQGQLYSHLQTCPDPSPFRSSISPRYI
jgi:hypothetical protein